MYRDPDSGEIFADYDTYMRAWLDDPKLTDEGICAEEGHPYVGDDGDYGRCYCGLQAYPKGGLRKSGE